MICVKIKCKSGFSWWPLFRHGWRHFSSFRDCWRLRSHPPPSINHFRSLATWPRARALNGLVCWKKYSQAGRSWPSVQDRTKEERKNRNKTWSICREMKQKGEKKKANYVHSCTVNFKKPDLVSKNQVIFFCQECCTSFAVQSIILLISSMVKCWTFETISVASIHQI